MFVIRLLVCTEQFCDIVFKICFGVNVSFVAGVPDIENPENVPSLIVLDDLINSAYSTKGANYLPNGRIIVILARF